MQDVYNLHIELLYINGRPAVRSESNKLLRKGEKIEIAESSDRQCPQWTQRIKEKIRDRNSKELVP